MKNIFITLFFLMIFTQNHSQSTKQKATLYFNDGRELSCYARISGDYIRYADEKFKGNEEKANPNNLKMLKIWMNDKLITLEYKTEVGKSKPKLMELVIDGKVKLYRISDVYDKKIGFHSNSDMMKRKTSSTKYFLEEKNNTNLVFRFAKDFESKAKVYFKDCNLLVQKIGDIGFRQKDILEIVIYYNENCN